MLDIHDCTNKEEKERYFEVSKSRNNVNNAIYLLETNKNIYKLCETKDVFSKLLN
jgi:hypothetical protein